MLRYARQSSFFGVEKQKKLVGSTVVVLGLGSVGSVAAEYLARAGVNLRLIDRDIVEETNLNRQLYEENEIGKPKASSLAARLKRINSSISINYFCEDFNSSTAGKLLEDADMVIDGLDNFQSRLILNDICIKNSIPFIHTSAIEDKGVVMLVIPKKSPCLSCVFQNKTSYDTCETAGIMPSVSGMIAMISVNEAVKYLAGIGKTLEGLLSVSLLDNKIEKLKTNKRASCEPCNGVYKNLARQPGIQQLCSNAYHINIRTLDMEKLRIKINKNPDFIVSGGKEFLGLTYRNRNITLFKNRMIVKNVSSEAEAKSIASKIVGM